jgi:glucose-1-phosphate thymidylyltransferase
MNTGIILLGGKGLRISPQSKFVNKHMNMIYDKPVFFYSITALILSGIDKLVISCNKIDRDIFDDYSKYLCRLGLITKVVIQSESGGIPTAIEVCKKEIEEGSEITVILGDNLIFGNDLFLNIKNTKKNNKSMCFLKKVPDPENFGIAKINSNGKILNFVEKPKYTNSRDRAVIGFYKFPFSVFNVIDKLKPSRRGETEIVDVLQYYKKNNKLNYFEFGRGVYWSDMGSYNSILDAGNFIKNMQLNSNQIIGLPEEALIRLKKISKKQLKVIKKFYLNNKSYVNYLNSLY